MSTNRDVDRIVRSWMDEGVRALPDRVLDAVLDQLPMTPQRRPRWSVRRLSEMHSLAKLAFPASVVGIVAILAIVGINLLFSPGLTGEAPSPRATPGLTGEAPSPRATPSPQLIPMSGELAQGRYFVQLGTRVSVFLTVPAGWTSSEAGLTIGLGSVNRPSLTVRGGGIYLASDVCASEVTLVQVATVEGLVTALVNQAGVQRSGPDDLVLGGYRAKRFVISPNPVCPGPEGKLIWAEGGGGVFWVLEGGTGTIYVVDVGGEDPLVITTSDRAGSAEDRAQLDAIIASIEIKLNPQ